MNGPGSGSGRSRLLRGLGVLLLLVLAYIAMGGVVRAVEGRPAPRGRFVDIGGRRLRIVCEGPAGHTPTVVLEAGAFGFSADWAVVQARLAAQGVRSCAYDRAGMGYSDPGPAPRDGIHPAEDLERLLAVAGEPPPYVLVGHSMAGLRIRLFYGRNRDKVAGLVFVDAASPELSRTRQLNGFIKVFGALSNLAGGAAPLGLLKPLSFMGDTIGLPPDAAAEKRWAFGDGRHNRTSADEVAEWPRAADQAVATGPVDPATPVAVITAGHGAGGAMKAAYASPARASRHGYVASEPDAGHADLLGERHADAVVKAIDFVLQAAKGPAESR